MSSYKKKMFDVVKWMVTRGVSSELELAKKTGLPRLQTIPFSHYCEMSRWALEHHGVELNEKGYLPGLNFPVAQIRQESSSAHSSDANTKKKSHPEMKVPCLVFPDGSTLNSSWDIVEYAFVEVGNAESSDMISKDLREYYDESFAPAVRVVVYYHILGKGMAKRWKEMIKASSGSLVDRTVYSFVGSTMIEPTMKRHLDINERNYESAVGIIREGFQRRSDRLRATFEQFPSGVEPQLRRSSSFMSVDPEEMIFAALAAPLLLPHQYGGPRWQGSKGQSVLLPYLVELPEELAQLVRELRDTQAGKNAIKAYSKRHASR